LLIFTEIRFFVGAFAPTAANIASPLDKTASDEAGRCSLIWLTQQVPPPTVMYHCQLSGATDVRPSAAADHQSAVSAHQGASVDHWGAVAN
jgi:hypothetical protein